MVDGRRSIGALPLCHAGVWERLFAALTVGGVTNAR